MYEEDGLVFFKERKVSLRQGSDDGIKKVDPKFLHRMKYFIKNSDGEVEKVKLKKKDIFSKIPEKRLKEMKSNSSVKGKRLKQKLKEESDFVAFF